jgi:hypothetical protein
MYKRRGDITSDDRTNIAGEKAPKNRHCLVLTKTKLNRQDATLQEVAELNAVWIGDARCLGQLVSSFFFSSYFLGDLATWRLGGSFSLNMLMK